MVEILGCSIFHAKGLRDALAEEHHALENQDMDALMTAIRDKGECVRELQALDRKRSELCSESGFAKGPDQMQQFTEWCDDNAEVAHSWGQLIELADECNTMNMSNGAVIRVRKQQVEDGISVLRGTTPGAPTYSRGGDSRGGLGNRAIAEA